MSRKLLWALALAGVLVLALPTAAFAQDPTLNDTISSLNTLWVVVAGVLVMFMQAGFVLLEIGFSRMKNAGAGVAKILVNYSIASICLLGGGVRARLRRRRGDRRHPRVLPQRERRPRRRRHRRFRSLGVVNISPAALLFFQFVFCAVSLAIIWGTTLERIKFAAYVIYAVIFSALIYPIISHWIFGGGWLQANLGMQDFAGSTVVHLIGATGALAALLLLGARRGKYGRDGKPRAIPGHSMPLVGLGVLILWLGWFGFNPGSTLGALGNRFAEVALVTNLAAAAGVITAVSTMYLMRKTIDIGMAGNGAIAGLVAITAPSGYVEFWAAPIIGAIAGVVVVFGVLTIDKYLDDPVGALSAHGLAGIVGHALLRDLHLPAAGRAQRRRRPGPLVQRQLPPAGRSGARHSGGVRVRVRGLIHRVLRDQAHDRSPRDARGRGRRARHLRARHVRLPRAVHPAARVPGCGERAPARWPARARDHGDDRGRQRQVRR